MRIISAASDDVHATLMKGGLQDAEAAEKAAEAKAVQDELDRQQRIQDSYAAQMPDEISQKVQAALQQEMVCSVGSS